MKKSSETDWKLLESMADEEIDCSDIPPLPDSFFEHAKVWRSQPKVSVTVELDADILDWFKTEGLDWREKIQTALRVYVEANKAYRKDSDSAC